MTEWFKTPTALLAFTLGTSALGAIAATVLAKRIEKEGWTKFPAYAIVGAVGIASALNLLFAITLKGEK